MYWTGKSSVKLISLISRENQIFSGPVRQLCVCARHQTVVCSAGARWKRCIKKVWDEVVLYVSKNTSTAISLYFTAHIWRNRAREDTPVPWLKEEWGNRWILAICFCKLCQPPVASLCECVIDWLVCSWKGSEWLGEKANPAHPLFRWS